MLCRIDCLNNFSHIGGKWLERVYALLQLNDITFYNVLYKTYVTQYCNDKVSLLAVYKKQTQYSIIEITGNYFICCTK